MEDFKFFIPEEYRRAESIEVAVKLLDHYIHSKDKLITYSELCRRLSFEVSDRYVDFFLGHISFTCKENGLPPVSAIVVNKRDYIPGPGFFKAYFPNKKITKENRDEIIMEVYRQIFANPYWDRVLEVYQTQHCS